MIAKQQSIREETHPVCLLEVEKYKRCTKQQVKNEQVRRKQTCSLCFVNVFKCQENKFKIVQKNILEIEII